MVDIKKAEREFDFHGEALDNIFDSYKLMREKCPIGHSDKHGGFWFLTKSEDIFSVEQDAENFTVKPTMLVPPVADFPMIPIDMDPPEQTEYRRLLLPLVSPQAVNALEPFMRETAQRVATEFLETGKTDASTLFARPYPTIVFSKIAGFPEKDWPKFDAWVDDILYARVESPEARKKSEKAVIDYFDNLLDEREALEEQPADAIGALIESDINGKKLTRDELLSYCYLFFLGGLDTTAWAIRSALWYFARNPKDQQRVRDNPDMMPDAAEEFLRTMAPVQAMARRPKHDLEIRGQKIKKGETVVILFGAGNRDPDVYDNPEEIQIDRQENKHLAFGAGHHRCLGSNLGRREMVVALQEFFKIVPEFTAADKSEVWHGVGPLNINIKK